MLIRSLISILLTFLANIGYSQSFTVGGALKSHHFTFTAQSAMPLRGISHTLTPDYTLRLTKDSLSCYLPYFGRQYTAPTPDEMRFGGYQFAVNNYSYQATAGKRGGWDVTIKTHAQQDEQSMTLSCSKNGWCQLYITSTGKEAISYYGKLSDD